MASSFDPLSPSVVEGLSWRNHLTTVSWRGCRLVASVVQDGHDGGEESRRIISVA
jgi:transposase-like protein